jgi:hypothetical protein
VEPVLHSPHELGQRERTPQEGNIRLRCRLFVSNHEEGDGQPATPQGERHVHPDLGRPEVDDDEAGVVARRRSFELGCGDDLPRSRHRKGQEQGGVLGEGQ